jgi:hypothetical protein
MRQVTKLRDPKVISLSAAKFYWWKTKFGLCPEMQKKKKNRLKIHEAKCTVNSAVALPE